MIFPAPVTLSTVQSWKTVCDWTSLKRRIWRENGTKAVIGIYREKECSSDVSSRFFGGALRDIPKKGCEGDYIAMLLKINWSSVKFSKLPFIWFIAHFEADKVIVNPSKIINWPSLLNHMIWYMIRVVSLFSGGQFRTNNTMKRPCQEHSNGKRIIIYYSGLAQTSKRCRAFFVVVVICHKAHFRRICAGAKNHN